MNTFTKLTVFGALALSSSSYAHDCRAIFEPGYSKEVQALLGKKFILIDEDTVMNPASVPFHISVKEDLDADPETLTLSVALAGNTIINEKRESEGFYENVARAEKWLKNLPSCSEIYKARE